MYVLNDGLIKNTRVFQRGFGTDYLSRIHLAVTRKVRTDNKVTFFVISLSEIADML